jgi:polyisoprenyl-teichoic acid--peptidoglycan teichoic acid transferase
VTTPTPGPASPAPSTWRARYVPAVLDALFPGLGHLVAGRRKLAAIFGIPFLALILVCLLIVATTSGGRLAAEAINVFWLLIGVQGIVLVWRVLAAGTSLFAPGLPRLRPLDIVPIGVLLLFLAGPQAVLGYVTNEARIATDEIFVGSTVAPGAWTPQGSVAPDPSDFLSPAPSFSEAPSVAPSASAGPQRINILLIGLDSGFGRDTSSTDTMIVASLDPVSETVSMISVPRELVNVPLPDGRVFAGKINGLYAFARNNPRQFPGASGQGYDVLMAALGTLLKLNINYYASVNLQGFPQVIDAVGGIDVNVAHSFCDPTYDMYGYTNGFSITAGRHHLNGIAALAYARVRKASGESDFTRAARQQEVLNGLRDAIVKGGFLKDPIGLLRSIGRILTTNVPRSILPDLADDMARVGRGQTYRAVIDHPFVKPASDYRGSIQLPNLPAIRALAASLFTSPGTTPSSDFLAPPALKGGGGSGVGNCAPAPTPKPKPTPKPSHSPGSPSPQPSSSPVTSPTESPKESTKPTPKPTASPSTEQSPKPSS